MFYCFLTALPFFLHSLTSLISCLNLPSGTHGRSQGIPQWLRISLPSRRRGSIPGPRSPLEKEMTTYSSILAWKPMNRKAWRGCKESDMTEHTQGLLHSFKDGALPLPPVSDPLWVRSQDEVGFLLRAHLLIATPAMVTFVRLVFFSLGLSKRDKTLGAGSVLGGFYWWWIRMQALLELKQYGVKLGQLLPHFFLP